MHKALMQFQINYLQQCSFCHPVLLWLLRLDFIKVFSCCLCSSKGGTYQDVVLVYAFPGPVLAIHASKTLCIYSVSITFSFSFCLSTGFPSYSWLTAPCSVVSDICNFFLLHFHLSFLSGLWFTASM